MTYHRRAEGGEVREGEPRRQPVIGVAVRVQPRICRPPQRVSDAATKLDMVSAGLSAKHNSTLATWHAACRMASRFVGSLNSG